MRFDIESEPTIHIPINCNEGQLGPIDGNCHLVEPVIIELLRI